MSIELSLETSNAIAGVDRDALIANVRAEFEKLERHAKSQNDPVEVSEDRTPPPPNAQGVDQLILWAVEFAQNPALAPVYARGLIFAVNELLRAVKKGPARDGAEDRPGFGARLKVLGREISLPATQAAITEFLKGLDAGG